MISDVLATRSRLGATLASSRPARAPAVSGYYVDSVNGDDGNSGTSLETAFQSFAALPALSGTLTIHLVAGSVFTEQLTALAGANLTIDRVGSGALPIIDCSDALSSGGWTDSTGRADANTLVYSRTLSTNAGGVKDWVNAYEDGLAMTVASSLANCQATAGSAFVVNPLTTTPVLYIHPTGNGNPASNGKAYRASVREYAILAREASVLVLENIQMQRNLSENGSLNAPRGTMMTGCTLRDGSKHCALVNDGIVAINCTFLDVKYNGTASLLVVNDDDPTGLGITLTNCVFQSTAQNTQLTGIESHVNVSGNFGAALITDCTFSKLNLGIGLEDPTSVQVIGDPDVTTATDCKIFYRANAAITHHLTDCSALSTAAIAPSFVTTTVPGATFNLTRCDLTGDAPANGLVTMTQNSSTVNLSDCDLVMTNASVSAGCVFFNTALTGCSLTVNNSCLRTNAGQHIRDLTTTLAYVGNNNQFWSSSDADNFFARYHNVNQATLAAWRTATGQDANSTVEVCS